MQFKDQQSFLLVGVPEEAEAAVAELAAERVVDRSPSRDRYDAIVGFVRDKAEIDGLTEVVRARANGDNTLVWICYPKRSSKKYAASINRDAGWDSLLDLGWDGVRQVAFDEDWSALRFRPRDAIATYTRKKQIGRSE